MAKTFKKSRRVHWGECSPSGAVFYPIYFHWFDEAAWDLFESLHLPIADLGRRFNVVGMPLIDCGAEFKRPVRLGFDLQIESSVVRVDDGEIHLMHVVSKESEPCVIGRERRFWGVRHESQPGRLRRGSIPDEVIGILREAIPS